MKGSMTATGAAQVQGLARLVQDPLGVAQVGVDVGGDALGALVSRARAWASTMGSLST
jgi:hypothetical protein